MAINIDANIDFHDVKMEGAHDVKMKILIGIPDGSDNIIMRHFKVAPNGNTPRHQHDYEHVVKIEKNRGIFIDANGTEHELTEGMSLYVEPNTDHQFKNPYDQPFEFLCIIPNPDKNKCC
jgi:quercetin dioxygenase-like cupin family protein